MEEKFEKVVEWDKPKIDDKEVINDKHLLIIMVICMIPIFGQLFFITVLMNCLKERKVYWRKIK